MLLALLLSPPYSDIVSFKPSRTKSNTFENYMTLYIHIRWKKEEMEGSRRVYREGGREGEEGGRVGGWRGRKEVGEREKIRE